MNPPRSILCPIDFSEASRGALHYAIAIAERSGARLTLLAAADEVLAGSHDQRLGRDWTRVYFEQALRKFLDSVGNIALTDVGFDVRVGKPAPGIVAAAAEPACDLIVMSTHGRTGVRKWVMGSTAEQVLRETRTPVLLTPPSPVRRSSFDELVTQVSPALVPIDFGAGTALQVKVAGALAQFLHLHLLLGHVVQPIQMPPDLHTDDSELMEQRYRRACRGLEVASLGLPSHIDSEVLLAFGEPSEEIAHWVRQRNVGLLIMSAHGEKDGIGLGSVPYRTIALTHILTLILPVGAV